MADRNATFHFDQSEMALPTSALPHWNYPVDLFPVLSDMDIMLRSPQLQPVDSTISDDGNFVATTPSRLCPDLWDEDPFTAVFSDACTANCLTPADLVDDSSQDEVATCITIESPDSSENENHQQRLNHAGIKSRQNPGLGQQKPMLCPVEGCGALFGRKEHLNRHYRGLHTMERPYPCKQCPKRFSRSDNLKQHIETHDKEMCRRKRYSHRQLWPLDFRQRT